MPSRIAVLCGNLPSYDLLAFYTIQINKREYCLRHGYHLETIHSIRPKFADPQSHAGGFSWSRLEHMAEMVESGRWDWVWCVGADTLITNFSISLESIIAPAMTPEAESALPPKNEEFTDTLAPPPSLRWEKPEHYKQTGKKHLLICGERVAPIQADSFLVRGSKDGSDYLRNIISFYERYKHHPWVENQAMIDLRHEHAAITYIVPQCQLNAYDYRRWHHAHSAYKDGQDCYGNRGQWQHGDFLIHWPAATLEQRLKYLDDYHDKIVK